MPETHTERSLLLVPAWPGQPSVAELARAAAAGERPRTDYVELARALDADVTDMAYLERHAALPVRALVRRGAVVPGQIAEAFPRRGRYRRHIVARADRLGLPLAALCKLTRTRADLVLISVWLSRRKKTVFLRPLGAHTHLKAIVNYDTVQLRYARERLGVPGEKLHHAPQPVDERFWRPEDAAPEELVCAVGSEARDYARSSRRSAGSTRAWSSRWGPPCSRRGTWPPTSPRPSAPWPSGPAVERRAPPAARPPGPARPVRAQPRRRPPPARRPLRRGGTSIAEAMAMGKPVVVTRSRGQVDLVREGETGLYVPPGDPAALERVLGDPAALRAALERVLDNSVAHVARIVRAPS